MIPRLNFKWPALVTATLVMTAALAAQGSQALIDALIKKGILTNDEAAQIQAEANAAAKPVVVPASAATTIVSGKMYIDFTDIDAETASGTKLNPSGIGLDVKRVYFGVTHKFNDVWLANINTDAAYSTATGATNLYMKTAYLQATLSPAAIVQIGSANLPWVPFVEDTYGFRYVENVLIDRLHQGTSADWGVHILGQQGIVSYNFAAINGNGYKNPSRSKSVDYAGRVSIEPVAGLTLAAGAYAGKLGKDLYGAPADRTATRYDVLAAYRTSLFRVGAEYFTSSDWGLANSAASDKADGYSVFGDVKLGGPFSVFARHDDAKTSKKLHPSMDEEYFNAGIQYHAFAGIDLALVYKHDHVSNPAAATQAAKYDEFGLFSQVAF